ncbi:EpsG family protein [Paraclostridium bifermentans]|uniref:EpsG family protein n=2 Tax=Paraclostridium bifermentans TaxID=1490 RepID=A0A5P3XIB6_PARBF|nr:EpsG family protein [Paraclostridium bifermentans]QEZ70104.1 EpsG family protein [Paraclostridium bifermentans]
MVIYNLNLALVYICGCISRINMISGRYKIVSKILNFIMFLSMWIVAGIRYNVGTDYTLYSNYFKNINSITLENSVMEIGYMWLNKVTNFFCDSNQIIFIVTSFITIYLVFKTILKYSKRYELSLYLFITMYFYYSSFNITRQYIAIAITFYAIKYIINSNFKKYIISVIVASLFHNSALIMIPFYFILKMNINKKLVLNLTILSIISFASIGKIINIVFTILPRYQKYVGSSFLSQESSWMHLIVIIALIVIVLPIKNRLIIEDKKNNIYINAIIFAAIFQLLGLKTVLFSRMVMYLYIYAIILVPNILSILNLKLRPIIYLGIIVIYYANCAVLLKTGNSEVLPYLYRLP